MLNAVNYSEARKNLASIMDSVCDSSDVVVVTRRKSRPVVIMSLDEYNSIQETGYLLRNPANAERLRESIEDMKKGNVVERQLIEDTAEND